MKDVVEPEIAAIREDVVRRSVGLVATLAAQEQDFGGTQPHERELEMVSVMVVGSVVSLAAWWMDHPEGAAQRDRRGRDGVPVGGARAGARRRALLGFLTDARADLTPRARGAFIQRDTASVPVVPGRAPGRRVPLPGGVGRRAGGRRLLPGDVPVGDAGLSAPARQLQPAGVGAHDRPPQGARLASRAPAAGRCRWPSRPSRGRQTERPSRTRSCGARCGGCRASSARRLRCATRDLPHDEIGRVLGCSEEAARRNVHEGLKKLRSTWKT